MYKQLFLAKQDYYSYAKPALFHASLLCHRVTCGHTRLLLQKYGLANDVSFIKTRNFARNW